MHGAPEIEPGTFCEPPTNASSPSSSHPCRATLTLLKRYYFLYDRTYISTYYFITFSGCGKWRRVSIGPMVKPEKARTVRYWNYLEDYWPCAGVLSAGNAIGTQMRDLINSGLARWRVAV